MLDNKSVDLSNYRLNTAEETLVVAQECYSNNHYKDAINRAYYAAFYAARAVLAIEGVDFKRHKDVVAHFNKEYVATGKCRENSEGSWQGCNKKENRATMMIFL